MISLDTSCNRLPALAFAGIAAVLAQPAAAWDAGPEKCKRSECTQGAGPPEVDGIGSGANGQWRGNTHLWIVNRALDSLNKSDDPNAKSAVEFLRKTECRNAWMDGLWDMDAGGHEDSAKPGSHFYNGAKKLWDNKSTSCVTYKGGFGQCFETSGNALTNADRHRKAALATLIRSKAKSYLAAPSSKIKSICSSLGKSFHYMTDITMPMHASGLSGGGGAWQYKLMLHPVVEEYVPVIQGTAFERRDCLRTGECENKVDASGRFDGKIHFYYDVPSWEPEHQTKSPSEILSLASQDAQDDMKSLINALSAWKDANCTYSPEVGVTYTGRCFRGDTTVDNKLRSILKTAVKSTANYIARSLSITKGSTALTMDYTVEIDCYHSSLKNEGTKDSIKVCLMSGSKEEGCAEHRPDCKESRHAIYQVWGSELGSVQISTNGKDAFFIDKVLLKSGAKTMSSGETIERWGIDDKGGWCLSKDPKDANGDWKTRIAGGECVRSRTLKVGSLPKYKVSIDCNHAKIDSTGTKNPIEVCAYAGTKKQDCVKKVPDCGLTWNAEFELEGTGVTHLTIETTGHDAFFMDSLSLEGPGGRERARWGRENGKGWCLSKDLEDNDGAWAPYVDRSCYRGFKFDVSNQKAYGVGGGRNSQAMSPYKVKIDCNHSKIDNEGTKNKVKVCTYKDNKVQKCESKRPSCGSTWDANYKVLGEDITDIRIFTDGNDGFFMDEVYVYSPNGKLLKQYGRDDGKGWCLSKDKGDNKGSWKSYVSSRGCFRGFKFVRKTGKAYGIR